MICVAGILCMGILLCLCGGGEDVVDHEREAVKMEVVAVSEEELCICVKPSLMEISQGRVTVLLIQIEVASGHTITDISLGEGALDMVLTVSLGEQGSTAYVLLDGIPSVEGEELLRIKTDGNGARDLRISGVGEGDLCLYCMSGDGEIMTYPIQYQNQKESMDGEDTSESITEIHTADVPTAERITENPEPIPMPQGYPTLVGCRETKAKDGVLTVQFLFCGGHMPPAVYCIRGKGSMRLEVERCGSIHTEGQSIPPLLGEAWYCATFYGVLDWATYRFGIMTEEGEVFAVYENGEFAGFFGEQGSGRAASGGLNPP